MITYHVRYCSAHGKVMINAPPYETLEIAEGVIRNLFEIWTPPADKPTELLQMEDNKVIRQWKFSSQEEADKILKPLLTFL